MESQSPHQPQLGEVYSLTREEVLELDPRTLRVARLAGYTLPLGLEELTEESEQDSI